MQQFFITGFGANKSAGIEIDQTIYCPSARGLSETQFDLSFVMPRIDHNRVVRENDRRGDWVSLLTLDPFGSSAALLDTIREKGYKGVVNWPSSILLEATIRQAMETVPANPRVEYTFLRQARETGLETMAFFRSLQQAQAALDEGMDHLIMHPGIMNSEHYENRHLVKKSLQHLIESIQEDAPHARIYVYSTSWHEQFVEMDQLPVDGLVTFKDGS